VDAPARIGSYRVGCEPPPLLPRDGLDVSPELSRALDQAGIAPDDAGRDGLSSSRLPEQGAAVLVEQVEAFGVEGEHDGPTRFVGMGTRQDGHHLARGVLDV
jgi:hypothetical protein